MNRIWLHGLLAFLVAFVIIDVAYKAGIWLALGVGIGFLALYQEGRRDGRRQP